MVTQEEAAAIATLTGATLSVLIFLYRVFKVSRVFLKDHEYLKESIETIKSEVTPNGGSSLKDTVNKLSKTCDRIETRQKVLDQRSKAALHYHGEALFETDKQGRLIWCNEKFHEVTSQNGDVLDGHDWISIIHDDKREDFLTEFNSCLKMNRKLDASTVSVNGDPITFIGYPYRTGKSTHEGFLINCILDDAASVHGGSGNCPEGDMCMDCGFNQHHKFLQKTIREEN